MNAQKRLLGLGASVLALGGAVAEGVNSIRKVREKQQRELFNRYKQAIKSSKRGYEKEANIKQENKQIVNNIAKPETSEFGIENIIVSQPEVKQQQKQKYILSEEGATYPITAETSRTNIKLDEDVQGLITVKSKNLKKAAATGKSQKKWNSAVEEANVMVGGKKDDIWNAIGLDPNITDQDIRKAGLTKTEIMDEFAYYSQFGEEWSRHWNAKMAKEGKDDWVVAYAGEDNVLNQANNQFGKTLSAYINYNKLKEEYAKAEEEYYNKLEETETDEQNYFVWESDESIEEDNPFDKGGIVF